MCSKMSRLRKRPSANVAEKLFDSVVDLEMLLQVCRRFKCLRAELAIKQLSRRVGHHVTLQRTGLAEGLVADSTSVGFFGEVGHFV